MPDLWVRIVHIEGHTRNDIREFWDGILQECINNAMNEVKGDVTYQQLNCLLRLRYAPYTFNNGRYDYIVPVEPINTIDDAIEYIRLHHKVYNPAYAIVINNTYFVIGGLVPCGCTQEICVLHRSKSCFDLNLLALDKNIK